MIVCEHILEDALRTFFEEAKLPITHNRKDFDLLVMKKCVPAFISALEEIEKVDYCYGYDQTKIFQEF